MAQTIKYQSTAIEASKTIAELSELIRKYGGSRFEQIWSDDGRVSGVRFAIRHPDVGELPVVLTQRTGEIERLLREAGYKKTAPPEAVIEQAERIAWRHTKDLAEQLLLSVSLGQRSLAAAFMADIEAWDDQEQETVTLAELFARRAEISSASRGVELTGRRHSEAIELSAAKED